MPPDLAPMLVTTGLPRSLEGWTAEPKLDGWRARAVIHDGEVIVRTRGGHNVAQSVPHLRNLAGAGLSVVLDGELVAGAGRAEDFYQLAGALARKGKGPVPVTFVTFDVLWADGELLITRSQRDRRALLEAAHLSAMSAPLMPSFGFEDAAHLLRACELFGAEGIVLKDGTAPYRPGVRSTAWRKVKVAAWREHLERRFAHRTA